MKDRPTINNIHLLTGGKWITRTFLPIFDKQLIWDDEADCGSCCPLACHVHPLVQDEGNKNVYHKLCTLTALKAGLVTRKEIIEDGR